MYRKIVLAYDGSQEGQKALINCKEMASWGDAEIHLISVIPEILGYPIGEGIFIDTEYQEIQNKKSQQQQLENGVDLIKKEGIKLVISILKVFLKGGGRNQSLQN